MNLPAWLTRIFLVLAAILLGAGFWPTKYFPASFALLAMAAIGLVFLWRGWGWFLSILLVLFTGSAAAGIYLEVTAVLMYLGLLAILLAWDQEHFASRIKSTGRVGSLASLTKAHYMRLAWVSLAGLFLVGLANLVQIEFTFSIAVLLASLAVLGLSQGIAYLRRSGL
jgi:hypothetical protein